jgi:hypothetical protein
MIIILLILIFLGILFSNFWIMALYIFMYNKERQEKIKRLYEKEDMQFTRL